MNLKAIKAKLESYYQTTTPEQVVKEFEDLEVEFEKVEYKPFLVYGHTSKGEPVIVEVLAENGAEALELARDLRTDCKFNHCNLK